MAIIKLLLNDLEIHFVSIWTKFVADLQVSREKATRTLNNRHLTSSIDTNSNNRKFKSFSSFRLP